ncbi:MAG: phosphoglucosamine mutase [Thaumarchaeota archaeon]|nr:phosphoglucosamine mutase [Nitrososphaerota archaeon]
MTGKPKLFGTNGIRGIPGKDYTLEFFIEIAQAIGTFFKKAPILIGYDGRNSSPTLSKAVTSGVLSVGLDVYDAGLLPTPALQFAVRTLGYKGGIMITASHNPSQYNGVKVMGADGVEVSRQQESEIEEIYYRKKYREADWNTVGEAYSETKAISNYLQGISKKVDADAIKRRAFKIVVDLGNGAQAVAAPYLLEKLGCKVISLNGQVDGDFPGRGAEPTPETLQSLAAAVKATRADLGVGYDGDGDRSVFCDDKGVVQWGDRTGALLTDHVLSKHRGGKVITTVSTSQVIDHVAEKHGSKVIRTKVGSVDVSREMIKRNAVFGLEENGGCCYAPHIPTRDGAMSTALMLSFLAEHRQPLSKLLASLPTFHQRKEKIECPRSKVQGVMKALEKKVSGKVERIDGLKIWSGKKAWLLMRPSGTEPVIRIFGEAESKAELDRLFDQYLPVLRRAAKNG